MSSEQPSSISTPTAILLGSIIVSAGLFLGLRSGKSDAPPPVAPPPVVLPSPVKPLPQQPSPPVVDKQQIIREAVAVLAKHKKALAEKCVAAALAKKPDPPSVKLLFNITFNAQGKPIARGVTEDRQTSRPEVTTCVNESLPEITVTPPGQTVLVDVPLELP